MSKLLSPALIFVITNNFWKTISRLIHWTTIHHPPRSLPRSNCWLWCHGVYMSFTKYPIYLFLNFIICYTICPTEQNWIQPLNTIVYVGSAFHGYSICLYKGNETKLIVNTTRIKMTSWNIYKHLNKSILYIQIVVIRNAISKISVILVHKQGYKCIAS